MSDVAETSIRIVRTPDVCSGQPRIEGTRWPTVTVLGWDFDREAMRSAYPHLAPEQIDVAMRYERSIRRKAGRRVWRARQRLAGWILGVSMDEIEESGL